MEKIARQWISFPWSGYPTPIFQLSCWRFLWLGTPIMWVHPKINSIDNFNSFWFHFKGKKKCYIRSSKTNEKLSQLGVVVDYKKLLHHQVMLSLLWGLMMFGASTAYSILYYKDETSLFMRLLINHALCYPHGLVSVIELNVYLMMKKVFSLIRKKLPCEIEFEHS